MEKQIDNSDRIFKSKDIYFFKPGDRDEQAREAKARAESSGKKTIRYCCQTTLGFLEECAETGLNSAEWKIFDDCLYHHPYANISLWYKTEKVGFDNKKIFDGESITTEIIERAQLMERKGAKDLLISKIADSIRKHNNEKVDALRAAKYLENAYSAREGESKQAQNSINPEFTIHRHCLAMMYLLKFCKVNFNGVNNTDVGRFIQFITGREGNNPKIANTAIYKTWLQVFNKEEKRNIQDLTFIKLYFEKLGLLEIVKMIDNDIDNVES